MEFQPDPRLRTKYYLQLLTFPIFFFALLVIPYSIMALILFLPIPWLQYVWLSFLFFGFVLCFAWTLPGLILIPFYYRRIQYRIQDDEIIVSRGIITQTRRVVPVRAITNVTLRRGPYDRIFRIGSVKIETAGQMGSQTGTSSPELALDGLIKFEDVCNHILELVRKYRAGYALTTELEPTPVSDTTVLLQRILAELQNLNKKLEKTS